eukprot:TRINITY_DN17471_c0_g1_i1.p1 TRINITY_DN17471_c0_g1~~TRINITY_DN17471_c0_g1_i1.p1  ORF type:complete len:225 (+),score=-17.52 TRINITY_DN17471_c0_g1_i1:421-1095(+)
MYVVRVCILDIIQKNDLIQSPYQQVQYYNKGNKCIHTKLDHYSQKKSIYNIKIFQMQYSDAIHKLRVHLYACKSKSFIIKTMSNQQQLFNKNSILDQKLTIFSRIFVRKKQIIIYSKIIIIISSSILINFQQQQKFLVIILIILSSTCSPNAKQKRDSILISNFTYILTSFEKFTNFKFQVQKLQQTSLKIQTFDTRYKNLKNSCILYQKVLKRTILLKNLDMV